MNRNKDEFIEYEVYKNTFNIELFNDIVTFIVFTTPIDKNGLLNSLEENHIWFKRKVNHNIHFKYFGELLERYKERIGTDIKDIRAIALALAYTTDIVTQQMIVGTQEIDFIKDIEKLAINDIYLKAALYLYDNKKYYNYLQDLKEYKYKKTEELIFVLSIFEDFNEGFNIFKEQLNDLIGIKKSIEVFNNMGIFNWLIKKLYPIINKSRGKEFELFRCLINVPTTLIKENHKIYNVLIEQNYSKEEIAFLNYAIIKYKPVPNTVRTRKSIVEEKIALNMCEVLLNSEMTYSNSVYGYIKDTISYYSTFDIKCYGFQRIKDALENTVNIKNPITFIELYEIMNKKIFSFNILDQKWDIVSEKFELREYRDLFDKYLLFNDFDKETLKKAIEKYNNLTNTSYINTFKERNYCRQSNYSKLVENDIIDLKEHYLEYINGKDDNIFVEDLKDYVCKIKTRKAFEFLKYFLQERPVKDVEEMNFGFKYMCSVNGNYYYDNKLDIKRDFLTLQENKQLFYWINEYIFKTNPESYVKFLVFVLKDDYLTSIFSKEDLRNVYFSIIKIKENLSYDTLLKEKYLTKQEFEEDKRREEEQRKQEELIKLQKKENELTQEFNDIKEYTFEKIYDFYKTCTWDSEGQEIKSKLVKNYLNCNLKKHMVTKDEIIYFNKICHMLLNNDVIDITKYKKYLFIYINEGSNVVCKEC